MKHQFLALAPLLLVGCTPDAPENAAAGNAAGPAPASLKAGVVDRSHRGQAASAAAFEDPDGAPTSLAAFAGRPVLLNLWATWCAPCVAELPKLDALAAAEQGRVKVAALSQDIAGRVKVEAFLADRAVSNLDAYLDPEMAVMTALKVEVLPTTILYDAGGKEIWRVTGEVDWTGPKAAKWLEEAVSPAAAH